MTGCKMSEIFHQFSRMRELELLARKLASSLSTLSLAQVTGGLKANMLMIVENFRPTCERVRSERAHSHLTAQEPPVSDWWFLTFHFYFSPQPTPPSQDFHLLFLSSMEIHKISTFLP